MGKKFDIFISYRHDDTREKAEHLKDILEPYFPGNISYDRENLEGVFDISLIRRIDRCRDFIIMVGRNTFNYTDEDFSEEKVEFYKRMGTCTYEEFDEEMNKLGRVAKLDFVRIELVRALSKKVNIIPLVLKDNDGFCFSDLQLPDDISGILRYNALTYNDDADVQFRFIVPQLIPRLKTTPVRRKIKLAALTSVIIVLLAAAALFGYLYYRHYVLRQELADTITFNDRRLAWHGDATVEQMQTVGRILGDMIWVDGGTFMMGAATGGASDSLVCADIETPQLERTVKGFWMCRYEVDRAEWSSIMDVPCPSDSLDMPVANVSFDECLRFAEKLGSLSNLNFALPTEEEWEFAARGGNTPDSTVFAGSGSLLQVASLYGDSLSVSPFPCDARDSSRIPNGLEIYDMSGNVCEWCDTDFRLYSDPEYGIPSQPASGSSQKVVRGGSFTSQIYEYTVFHRSPMNSESRSANVGMRLIIRLTH